MVMAINEGATETAAAALTPSATSEAEVPAFAATYGDASCLAAKYSSEKTATTTENDTA
jgi:hypothetical protein